MLLIAVNMLTRFITLEDFALEKAMRCLPDRQTDEAVSEYIY